MVNELELAYVTPIDDAEVLGEIKDTLGDEKNLSPYRAIQVSKFVMGSFGVRMTHQRHYYDLDSLTSVLFELSLHYTIFGVRSTPFPHIPAAPSIGVEIMLRESEDGKTNITADVVDELARILKEGEDA